MLVKNDVFGERRARLDRVLMILGDRLAGAPLSSRKAIPGVSGALLYPSTPPTYEDARQLLMEALEVAVDTVVIELFDALKQEGIHEALTALRR